MFWYWIYYDLFISGAHLILICFNISHWVICVAAIGEVDGWVKLPMKLPNMTGEINIHSPTIFSYHPGTRWVLTTEPEKIPSSKLPSLRITVEDLQGCTPFQVTPRDPLRKSWVYDPQQIAIICGKIPSGKRT